MRPLSARLLPETEPERRGWVDRRRLLAIFGRSRREQLALAERYGLRSYQSPGGGCLLTDPAFSHRLRDLFDHTEEHETSLADVELLRVGRHLRLSPELKIVLGRNADENRRLAGFESHGRWLVEPVDFSGPSALVCGAGGEEALRQAIDLIVRYARAATPERWVRWRNGDGFHYRTLGEPIGPAPAARPLAPAPAPDDDGALPITSRNAP